VSHHNNQISQLDNPNPSLIKFLEQNNLAEHQHQLLNSQLLNVQLAKSQANQLQPEAEVHSSQNMAKTTVQNTIQTTAQVPTQISTISAMIPTQTTIKILLPTVAITNSSSFPTGLSSKMPKIAKS